MSDLTQPQVRNRLLAMMKPADFDLIRPYLKRVTHASGDTIAGHGAPIDRICFPEGGVAAILAMSGGEQRVAIAVVGNEGAVGVGALLGQTHWSHQVVLRGAHTSGLVIDAGRLLGACRRAPNLQSLLLRFAGNLLLQVSRTSAVNLGEPLEQRLARWLLLYHDRLEGDEFPVTHEEMAIMLGVRRASTTDAIHVLEGEGAIRGLRGRVLVRNRLLLEEIAGHAYGDVEADYREKIGPFGKGPALATAKVEAEIRS